MRPPNRKPRAPGENREIWALKEVRWNILYTLTGMLEARGAQGAIVKNSFEEAVLRLLEMHLSYVDIVEETGIADIYEAVLKVRETVK